VTDEEIRTRWLEGTTCASKPRDVREVLFSSPRYIVMKHRAHAEYVDRGSKVQNCPAEAKLYRRKQLEAAIQQGSRAQYVLKPVKVWEGRASRSQILRDCNSIGVMFPVKAK
jgi:hypothetical protein